MWPSKVHLIGVHSSSKPTYLVIICLTGACRTKRRHFLWIWSISKRCERASNTNIEQQCASVVQAATVRGKLKSLTAELGSTPFCAHYLSVYSRLSPHKNNLTIPSSAHCSRFFFFFFFFFFVQLGHQFLLKEFGSSAIPTIGWYLCSSYLFIYLCFYLSFQLSFLTCLLGKSTPLVTPVSWPRLMRSWAWMLGIFKFFEFFIFIHTKSRQFLLIVSSIY